MLKKNPAREKPSKQKNIKPKTAAKKQAKVKATKAKAKATPITEEIMIRGKKAKLIKMGNVSILKMERPKLNKARENRIVMEYIVDCYDEVEKAMGWYYSVENKLQFPFIAKCRKEREVSPLQLGQQVEVIGMASEDECHAELFVKIKWEKRTLAVPLYQLQAIKVNEETKEAIEDWHYWKDMGYQY
jgi:hypothetical protein